MRTDEAAWILGYSPGYVRQLVRRKTLQATRIGPRILDVDPTSVRKLLRTIKGTGDHEPEDSGRQVFTAELKVEIDSKLVQIDHGGGAVYAAEIRIPVNSQRVTIQGIEIVTSNPEIAYRMMVFMHLPPGDHLPQDEPEDILQMNLVTRRAYYWKGPLPYENLDGHKAVVGALCVGEWPISFGPDYPYPRDAPPISFRIRISYTSD